MRLISKILLTSIVGAALYGGGEYYLLRKRIAVSDTLVKSAVSYEQHPAGCARRILVIGDSTGVGVGAREKQLSLAGLLGTAYPDACIVNRAVSGSRVRDIAGQLATLQGQRFDLVHLQVGGNDIVRFTGLRELQRDLGELTGKLRQTGGQVLVASCGNVGTAPIFPGGTGWLLRNRTLKVREIFRETVRGENLHYVDLYRERANDPFAREPATHYAADAFHPSAKGYEVWFRSIHAAIHTLPGWER